MCDTHRRNHETVYLLYRLNFNRTTEVGLRIQRVNNECLITTTIIIQRAVKLCVPILSVVYLCAYHHHNIIIYVCGFHR